jgi:hypothetical protein
MVEVKIKVQYPGGWHGPAVISCDLDLEKQCITAMWSTRIYHRNFRLGKDYTG